jgi:hypothetical protein
MEFNNISKKIKKSFNYSINYIFKQVTWFFVITTITYATYFIGLDFANNYIIEKFLLPKDFSFPFIIDVLFHISFLLLIIASINFSLKYKYAFKQSAVFFLGVCILLYHSNNLEGYIYLKDRLTNLSYIYYLNVLLLIPIFSYFYHKAIQHFVNPFKDYSLIKKTFLLDVEVNDKDNDVLNYNELSKKLCERILENDFSENSFSIGIIGPWGDGKSSFLNLLKTNLKIKKSKENLIISFTPSINHKENEIINEFISVLNENLSPYSAKLAPKLIEYTQHLTNAHNNKNILGLINIKQEVNISKSASELFNEINSCIEDIGKKVIILIDDLDRLEPKEILQVFKIIRNTASFKNTVFIIGLDKEYTIQRLLNSQEIHNPSYLNKFFQLEVHLPQIDNTIINRFFIDQLMLLNITDYNEAVYLEHLNQSVFEGFTYNFREVKRLLNQISFDYNSDNEILFSEFINVSILKITYPESYNWLLKNLKNKEIFEIKNGLYVLTPNKKNTKKTGNEIVVEGDLFDDIDLTNKEKIEIGLFNITNILFDEKSKLIIPLSIVLTKDKINFLKLIIALFGERKITDRNITIQNYLNIETLFKNKISKDKLTSSVFTSFLETIEGKDELDNPPGFLTNVTKNEQFFDKLTLYAVQDENQLKNSIKTILLLSFHIENNTYQLIQNIYNKVEEVVFSGAAYDFKVLDNVTNQNELTLDFSWFIPMLDKYKLSNFDKLNLLRSFNADKKLKYLGKIENIKTDIEKWLNNYYLNFYNEHHQYPWMIEYFLNQDLIDKKNCIETYKIYIELNLLKFTEYLIVNDEMFQGLYKIKKEVLNIIDEEEWLQSVYKTEYDKENKNAFMDVQNLLKLNHYAQGSIIRYDLKSKYLINHYNRATPNLEPARIDHLIIKSKLDYESLTKKLLVKEPGTYNEILIKKENNSTSLLLRGNLHLENKKLNSINGAIFNFQALSETEKTMKIFDINFEIVYSSKFNIWEL